MKKLALPLLFLILPLMLVAGVFPRLGGVSPFPSGSRAWRIASVTDSQFYFDAWVFETRMFPNYDPIHPSRIISLDTQQWDTELGEWVPDGSTITFEYNSTGRVIQSLIHYDFGVFEYSIKTLLTYDAQRRLTSYRILRTEFPERKNDAKDENLIEVMRMQIVYGAGGDFEAYQWDMDSELPYGREVFTFDSRHRIQEQTHYSSPDSLNWQEEHRSTFTYHPQDTSSSNDLIEYVSANMAFMMLFDDDGGRGMIQEETDYEWYDGWVFSNKIDYLYDSQLRMEFANYHYYDEQGTWQPSERIHYLYATNGQIESIITQYYQDTNFEDSFRRDYVWEQYTENSDEYITPAGMLKIKAYPSPFANQINISTDSSKAGAVQLDVYNLRGQKVQSFNSMPGNSVSWDGKDAQGQNLPSGVYLLRASQDGVTSSKKVMKIK